MPARVAFAVAIPERMNVEARRLVRIREGPHDADEGKRGHTGPAPPTDTALQTTGFEHPVFQAGIGWVARAELAAAVSAAGGLGAIGAGSNMTADELLS